MKVTGKEMAKYDRISTLFWIGIAIVICVESIKLDLGSLSSPGPGLIPLGCGLVLGIIALVVFAYTFKDMAERGVVLREGGIQRKMLVSIPTSIIGYAFLIDLLGFRLITFLWMGFMCLKLGRMGWKATVFTSVITTFSSYLLFQYYLGIRFPRGILGF